jgi:thiol:disulfide interchange protein DsbA
MNTRRQILGMALLAPLTVSAQVLVDSKGRVVIDLDAERRRLVRDITYTELANPLPSTNPNVIEVLSFFSWHCRGCYRLHPYIDAWKKTLPADVLVTRVPVGWGQKNWNAQARAWYAINSMGQLERLETEVLKSIHEQNLKLDSELELAGWLADRGLDAKEFLELVRSEEIVGKATDADKLARAGEVMLLPYLLVDGRYTPSTSDPSLVMELTGKLVDLVREQRSGKKTS